MPERSDDGSIQHPIKAGVVLLVLLALDAIGGTLMLTVTPLARMVGINTRFIQSTVSWYLLGCLLIFTGILLILTKAAASGIWKFRGVRDRAAHHPAVPVTVIKSSPDGSGTAHRFEVRFREIGPLARTTSVRLDSTARLGVPQLHELFTLRPSRSRGRGPFQLCRESDHLDMFIDGPPFR